MSTKEPVRYFVEDGIKTWRETSFVLINESGEVVWVWKNGDKSNSLFTRKECFDNVKRGWWKEIEESEAVLLL